MRATSPQEQDTHGRRIRWRPAAVPTPARCELDGADLSKLNMNGVMFDRAELQGANLVEATAVGSTFFKATPSHSRSLFRCCLSTRHPALSS